MKYFKLVRSLNFSYDSRRSSIFVSFFLLKSELELKFKIQKHLQFDLFVDCGVPMVDHVSDSTFDPK
jgi:hypothetical protein